MKIKLSRKQWENIGFRGGWLKEAGSVEVDGKWYDEDTMDEVPAPRIKMPGEVDHTVVNVGDTPYLFEVGGVYEDGAGKYEVKNIKDDGRTLKVIYLGGMFQGETREYPTLGRAKIIHNEAMRQGLTNRITPVGFTGNKSYFTLGYLAKYGFVAAQVPVSERLDFEERYKRLSGEDANKYANTSAYQIAKDETKWHLELSITFAEPEDEVLAQMDIQSLGDKTATITKAGNKIRVNKNNLIFNLFKSLDFKLGIQDIAKIRARVPQTYVGDFDAGASI